MYVVRFVFTSYDAYDCDLWIMFYVYDYDYEWMKFLIYFISLA